MKTIEIKKLENSIDTNQVELNNIEFGDVVVYNEMADTTEVKINLISQIHSQLNQIEEMSARRTFLLKEISILIS